MAEKQVLVICGEPSGDLHAATLVTAINKIDHRIKFYAVGGDLLAHAGAEIIYDIKGLSVMGLFDVIKNLPRFFLLKRKIFDKLALHKFNAVIFVDFSGFNLRLAKEMNHKIPTIYYVSPQVWASRTGRVKTIKRYIDRLIVLFKFEEDFYRKHGVNALFAGHPLLDIVKPKLAKHDLLTKHGLSESKTTIALLPGSRKQEITRILPIMLESARLINKELPAQFIIAKSANLEWKQYEIILRESGVSAKIIDGQAYDCVNAADFCLVCSGTATLETAIMEKPLAVIYKTSALNYFLYRPQIKLPYIGMVNIVAGKQIAPEFIQFNATAKKISQGVLKILRDKDGLEKMKRDLSAIKPLLGESGASARAAKIVLDFLK